MSSQFKNFATTRLAASLSASATTLYVLPGTGVLFPALSGDDSFTCVIYDASGNKEIIKSTGRAVDTFTIVRGQEGTTPRSWSANDRIEMRVTAGILDELRNAGSGAGEALQQFKDDLLDTSDNAKNDALVAMKYEAVDAVETTLHELYQALVINGASVFGIKGDGTEIYDDILKAFNYCYPLGKALFLPDGTYSVMGERSYPFNQGSGTVTTLRDCHSMVVFGSGPSTILKTISVNGADVLQVNGLKNFHLKNLQIESVVTGSDAGSNGFSLTGGWDNITLDHVWFKNLGFVDKTTYVDGGKAISIQAPFGSNTAPCGSFKATNIFANGCVYGFGFEFDPDLAKQKNISIEVDIIASNCRQAVIVSGDEADAELSTNLTNCVKIRAQAIDCMQDVFIARGHGIDLECQIITTKTQAARLLSYTGAPWSSADGIADVVGLTVAYAKNSKITAHGNKGNCRHKAKIGGASDPSAVINGSTEYCDFYLDITGTSDSNDIEEVDFGGNTIKNSRIYATMSTTLSFPTSFYAPALNNTLTIGPDIRVKNVNITEALGFTQSNGKDVKHNIFLQSNVLSVKQTVGSAGDIPIMQFLDDSGSSVFGIRNDGALISEGYATATSLSTTVGALPLKNSAGAAVGYIEIKQTYTP